MNHKTKYWELLADSRVQCDVCPRECKLNEGQGGLFFVRACRDKEITLTTYGRSSGFCIDPIEKKPLNHFLPGTPVLSFGTAGCNLTCKFCQNYDISKSRELDKLADQASPKKIAIMAEDFGCKSVAFTYNDPTIFLEYAIDVAQACRDKNIKTVAVTAGYISPDPRVEFFKYIDVVNIDLKSFTERFYKEVCSAHLSNVLETFEYLKHETEIWFEITTLLIPGENDSEREINEECEWIMENLGPDVPLHFSAFHPEWKMLNKPNTPPSTLFRARKIAHKHGLRYVYLGNIHDFSGSSTYCRQCGEILIGRNWYELSAWNLLPDGECQKCGTKCAGIFDGPPGTWGRKRQAIEV
jgi:pyruvate formate lyase activating enzyme